MAMNSSIKSRDTNISTEISKLTDSMNTFKVHSDQLSLKFSDNHQSRSSPTSKERSVAFLIPEDDDINKSHCIGVFTDEFIYDAANFDVGSPYTITTLPIQDEFHCSSPTDSPIDISVRDLNSDIVVSLADRAAEMRDLFIRNKEYFDTVRQSIFPSSNEQDWIRFLNLLYSPRYVISDAKWMSAISDYMEPNPTLLVKFKNIVGYCEVGGESENTGSNDYHDGNMTNASCEYSDSSYTVIGLDKSEIGFLNICAIRNYPKILENLEKSYPQFFVTAHQLLSQEKNRKGSVLGGNHLSQTRRSSCSSSSSPPNNDSFISNDCGRSHENNEDDALTTLYDEFKSILVAPRQTIPDEDWETAIYECLDPWPQLVEQFEEIVEYEISND